VVVVDSAPAAQNNPGCTPKFEAGTWVNASVEEEELAVLEISHWNSCIKSNRHWVHFKGPSWYVEATGKCGAANCSWGRVGAEQALPHPRDISEGIRTDMMLLPIFAAFDRGEFQIYLDIHLSPENPGFLHVHAFTDTPDRGLAPGKSEDWLFRRADLSSGGGMTTTIRKNRICRSPAAQ